MKLKNKTLFRHYENLVKTKGLLPIKVTDFYIKKVEEEIAAIGINGPLYRCSFPTNERMDLHSVGETPDYVCDRKNMLKISGDLLIQKYDDRVLLLISEKCFGHCQYCFRTQLLSAEQKNSKKQLINDSLKEIAKYIKDHKKVREVIFSGGDPLLLGIDGLEEILKYISENAGKISFRIHTRSIVYQPDVFDKNLCNLLKKYQVRLVFHISHPYELCDKVKDKVRLLKSFGIGMYNQFPILRNINDHEKVLAILLEDLDLLNIRQLSIFIPDPINYGAAFRMSLERIFAIVEKLNIKYPSWINSFRLVLDTPIGKVRRENIVLWDKRKGEIVFERNGKRVSYRDFPDKLDNPGKINKLLWKN